MSSRRWKLSQILARPSPLTRLEDHITTPIEFDKPGDHVAFGDRGGRVVIFERDDREGALNHQCSRHHLEQVDSTPSQHPKFRFKLEFQSHEPENDYLKKGKISQRIKKVKWWIVRNGLQLILSSNDKTIKFWKIKERKRRNAAKVVPYRFLSSENLSERSSMGRQETSSSASGYDLDSNAEIAGVDIPLHDVKCRKVYAGAHHYDINSISNNSDCETFISADDLRINLWNLEVTDQCFNIVDMKPPDINDLEEIITSAEFHPVHCNLLVYGSTRGFIRLFDLRQSARCDPCSKTFFDRSFYQGKSDFEVLAASISDVKFFDDCLGGQHLVSRDYMHMKLWDMRMESRPVDSFNIHESLRPRLPELYDKQLIFDQFDCCFSGDRLSYATGSYGNLLRIFSPKNRTVEDVQLDAIENPDNDRMAFVADEMVIREPISELTHGFNQNGGNRDGDLRSKLSHVAWHPTSDLLACANQNCLKLYHA